MQSVTILALAAAAAMAAPTNSTIPAGIQCHPGTYQCLADSKGWQVCNTQGIWEVAGVCEHNELCCFDNANMSPYCLPVAEKEQHDKEKAEADNKKQARQEQAWGAECHPGSYMCMADTTGWLVCSDASKWVVGGTCSVGELCCFYPLDKSPYCLPSAEKEAHDQEKGVAGQ